MDRFYSSEINDRCRRHGIAMSSEEDIARKLEGFGLSKKQALIYLLLIAHQELRIQEIAELAHIPRSTVYESLKALSQLGLIEQTTEENFKKIRAYPIGAIRHNLDEAMQELQQKVADLDDLERAITISKTGQPSTSLRYYRERSGARQIYWNSLKAKSEVYAYSDWSRRGYLGMKFYERFVTESKQRRVSEKVLTNPTPQALDSIRAFNLPLTPYARTALGQIRFLDKSVIQIKGDTLIYDNIYAQIYLNNSEINGFEIESQSFTRTQRSIFETLWKMGNPINDLFQGRD
ncbi:MAG TPA: helix-turn-helix domain-containing protein [Candidatus Saccharimonadales bacterium]|nr:helix-turn-helix domain-containing protein [Candidatus Saccharimonadales bacterium]